MRRCHGIEYLVLVRIAMLLASSYVPGELVYIMSVDAAIMSNIESHQHRVNHLQHSHSPTILVHNPSNLSISSSQNASDSFTYRPLGPFTSDLGGTKCPGDHGSRFVASAAYQLNVTETERTIALQKSCNRDNLLRSFVDPRYSSSASAYCSSYIRPTVKSTATVT